MDLSAMMPLMLAMMGKDGAKGSGGGKDFSKLLPLLAGLGGKGLASDALLDLIPAPDNVKQILKLAQNMQSGGNGADSTVEKLSLPFGRISGLAGDEITATLYSVFESQKQ
ncbi:MAG TPA: hypothetical protein P5161_05500 [Eubacteriales bacterium]|jgi:hypothetical protein|nr:hypothetical protein [Clostridia bacterium]HRR90212.1 hypothetical protein [Eubacteriales bacterium]HRU84864.1 hypothetical protein [Eubacteriales bacterium]